MAEDSVKQQLEVSPVVVWSNTVLPPQFGLSKHWSRIPAGIDA